jgi:hypothetical protein
MATFATNKNPITTTDISPPSYGHHVLGQFIFNAATRAVGNSHPANATQWRVVECPSTSRTIAMLFVTHVHLSGCAANVKLVLLEC